MGRGPRGRGVVAAARRLEVAAGRVGGADGVEGGVVVGVAAEGAVGWSSLALHLQTRDDAELHVLRCRGDISDVGVTF